MTLEIVFCSFLVCIMYVHKFVMLKEMRFGCYILNFMVFHNMFTVP